jgi:hypothetical protein
MLPFFQKELDTLGWQEKWKGNKKIQQVKINFNSFFPSSFASETSISGCLCDINVTQNLPIHLIGGGGGWRRGPEKGPVKVSGRGPL